MKKQTPRPKNRARRPFLRISTRYGKISARLAAVLAILDVVFERVRCEIKKARSNFKGIVHSDNDIPERELLIFGWRRRYLLLTLRHIMTHGH